MSSIPFIKYTHCGNSFVIVDEISQFYISEQEKLHFAHRASDVSFGIGSDNLLVIQPFRADVLKDINYTYSYWETLPTTQSCDFIFRFFDRNEALTCGNGLLCIATHLYRQYGIESARIMTEIPLSQPNVLTIGVKQDLNLSFWCNLGYPRRSPEEIVTSVFIEHYRESVDIINGLKIGFRSHDLHSFTQDTPLLLSGFLIFTGEPHLVIFPDECMPPELANTLFMSLEPDQSEKRKNFGSWLVNHIGAYINKHYQYIFPVGINVNFARIFSNTGTIQYRTYERGNGYETLACGTGAVAVSYIAKKLQLLTHDRITLLPVRCNWQRPNTKIWVEATTNGWYLLGNPNMLFMGHFMNNDSRQTSSLGVDNDLASVKIFHKE